MASSSNGRASIPLGTFRLLAKLLTWASVAATVAALYAFLHGEWWVGLVPLVAAVALLYTIQRLSIRVEPEAADLLVFVTKDQCTLCEEAEALLPAALDGTGLRLVRQRVEDDRLLYKTFRHRVPVLLWQGEVVAELRWDPEALRARLQTIAADARREAGGPTPTSAGAT